MKKQKKLEWKKLGGKIYRSCHQSIFHKNYIYLFLGEEKEEFQFSGTVVQYNPNTSNLTTIQCSRPIPRRNHVVVKRENFAYMFGGDYERLSDGNGLLKFNLEKHEWDSILFEKHEKKPSPRKYHCGCLCKNEVYIFGGECGPEKQFNDLWKLDINENWIEMEIKDNLKPKGRRYASIVSYNEYLYLFGGRNDEKRFNDLWQFNTFNNQWNLIKVNGDIPKPRASQTAIVDQNSMWIYGGNKYSKKKKFFLLILVVTLRMNYLN